MISPVSTATRVNTLAPLDCDCHQVLNIAVLSCQLLHKSAVAQLVGQGPATEHSRGAYTDARPVTETLWCSGHPESTVKQGPLGDG